MAKPIYGDLELKGQQTIRFADSDSSNVVSLGAPTTVGSDLALVLPSADTTNGAMVSDGSGNLSLSLISNDNVDASAAIVESKLSLDQNTADLTTRQLDNLASVAINTSLISDTDNTDDLGSAAIGWANAYANVLHMDSNSQTTAIQGSAAASASVTYSMPPADGTSGFVLSTNGSGVLSWVSNASSSSHTEDWDTADTATFAITHSLGTQDVIVQVYDRATEETIEVDSVVRTDANTVTVTASEAPPAGGWRVLILAV